MFRLTAVAVCVLLSLSATGQHRKYTVVLNDGSRIRGTIVGDSTDYLDLKITSPQVIRLGRSQVTSVEAVKYPVKRSMNTSGYYARLSIGFLAGKNESGNQSSLSFHLSNGYQFRNGFAVGIGSGMEELGVPLVPLYADLRFTPLNSGLSPYVWLKAGHGFAITDRAVSYENDASEDNNHDGGFLFNTGVGVSVFSFRRTAVNVGIGYRYQKVTLNEDIYWWYGRNTVRHTVTQYYRLEFHLGFVFM
ncbi:MAG: hypothetical protein RB288_05245 [Bacteroidales bacterium]|jgi:hypothetical protein|nr:hypothetical protein [Bacteroidales bacterium]